MTNRKEVAKRWREIGERLDKIPPTSLTGTACVTLFELLGSAGIRNNNSYSDVFNRLADLIDPTCHMSWECGNGDDDTDEYMELIVDTPEDTVACHCHACNIVFRFERGIVPDYCPFCGARMVRDEA